MSHTRILEGAALALLAMTGACQRRADGPANAGAVRPDTTQHDGAIGAGGTDSNTQAGTPPGSPDTVRRDSAPSVSPPAPRPGPVAKRPVTRAPGRSTPDSAKAMAADSATPAGSTTASADQPLRDAYHHAPLDTVDAKTYQGWKYFNLNCARCHGEDVQGTTIAPHLILSLKPDGTIPNEEAFQTTVCGGRVDKGMPAWCSLGLTPAQIDTIYTYVKGRSDAKLHPGRPARRE